MPNRKRYPANVGRLEARHAVPPSLARHLRLKGISQVSVRNPKVSVIVPACDVDRYVRRAVESVQNQTLGDFEILVVDAASTDRTADIVTAMGERDIRIDLLRADTSNLADACNLGLEHARGTYVYFLKGTDWIAPNALEEMVGLADDLGLEMVVAGLYYGRYRKDELVEGVATCTQATYVTPQEFRANAWQYFDNTIICLPWGKLFSLHAVHERGVRFSRQSRCGFTFMMDYLRDVRSVGVTERSYHHLLALMGPKGKGSWQPHMFDMCEQEHEWVQDLYRHWDLTDDESSKEMVERHYLDLLVRCVQNLYLPGCGLKGAEKAAEAERMVMSERAKTAAALAKPKSRPARVMANMIRRGNVRAVLAQARVMSALHRDEHLELEHFLLY